MRAKNHLRPVVLPYRLIILDAHPYPPGELRWSHKFDGSTFAEVFFGRLNLASRSDGDVYLLWIFRLFCGLLRKPTDLVPLLVRKDGICATQLRA